MESPSLFLPVVFVRETLSATTTSLSSVWDGDSFGWRNLSAGDITTRVTSKVCPGSIVLFYNAAKHTPEALPGIIERLTNKKTAHRLPE